MFFYLICMSLLFSIPGYPRPESQANYQIKASLDTDSSIINSSIEIEFINGTNLAVDTMWLHLYPNAYSDENTAFAIDLEQQGCFSFRRAKEEDRGRIELADWYLNGDSIDVIIDETLGYIVLDTPLTPGDTVCLSGHFAVKVPKFWSRMGHSGDTYEITQWYPKMCVLDEDGWFLSRYHASGEFYSDYGNYEVFIDVPADFITAATGAVITTEYTSDSLRRTDHWLAENVHDFAWCTSPDYIVKSHQFIYSSCNDTVSVHLVMLDDSEAHWKSIPSAVDSTLAYFGEWYMPYPYKDLWVVEPAPGSSGGMEYPQFVFAIENIQFTRFLEMVTIHEIGHQWFYGILGNNETEEAWLDEGMNTFSELRYMERNHGFLGNISTTPDWLLSISDRDLQALSYLSSVNGDDVMPVISTATDAADGSYNMGYTYYTKPALFLSMLQLQLGEQLFDEVMRTYFERFAFHHPKTEDFQVIVEELSGRSWEIEFDFWLTDTGSADIRLSSFHTDGEMSSALISCDLPHEMRVPVLFASHSDSLIVYTVLEPNSDEEIIVVAPGNWDYAVADPYMRIPDYAPWNNRAPISFELKPFLPVPKPDINSVWVLPYAGYADQSWQAKAIILSTPLPLEIGGPYTFTSHLSIPFKQSSLGSWGISLAVPVARRYRELTKLTTRFSSGFGINRLSSIVSWKRNGVLAIDPGYSVYAGIEFFNVSDSSVYGESNVETGSNFEFQNGMQYRKRVFNRTVEVEGFVFADPGLIGSSYGGLDINLELSQRFGDFLSSASRLNFSGRLGDVPTERRVRPGGGLFSNSIMDAFLPPDGTLSPSEHYFVRTGPALPGYWNSSLRGKAGFSVEQRFMNTDGSIGIFAGTGWVGDSYEDLLESSLISNAGLFVNLYLLEAVFPLWVSDPEPNEKPFSFRWRLEICL